MKNKELKKIDVFADKVFMSLFGKQNYLTELHFYLTEHCNLKCPGCYMRSSPELVSTVLPSDDINYFVKTLEKEPGFGNNITFSGGEIFTADLKYLEYNMQSILSQRFDLEIKTNGSWVANKKKADAIFEMLGRLNVPKKTTMTHQKLENFLLSIPNLAALSQGQINKKIIENFVAEPTLGMAVSVDNFIHPEKCADWFLQIAKTITKTPQLFNNLHLSAYSFNFSLKFVIDNVLNKLKLDRYEADSGVLRTVLNNQDVQFIFADFIETKRVDVPETFSEIMFPAVDADKKNRLVLFVYPDQTIGFTTSMLKSVGRVPYVTKSGEYKPYDVLRKEMAAQLIKDYTKVISR